MEEFNFLTQNEISQIFEIFQSANPNPQSELTAPNAYTFLVAVVLSAQATDKSVNKATENLFKIVQTPKQMIELGEENLISYIKSIGLYKAKAKHVIQLSHQLIENFDSDIPHTREELESLSGVGRKTANVVLNVVFGKPTMPVDTHILRISQRIGFSDKTKPEEVEKDLVAKIPERFMMSAHHWLILHGRYVCTARNPKCCECIISKQCKKNGIEKETQK